MDAKTLGWIQIVGGVLALVAPGGSIGMMRYSSSNWGVTILSVLFIIMGIHHLMEAGTKHKR